MAHIGGFVAGVILIFVFENPKKLEEEQPAPLEVGDAPRKLQP